MTSTMWRTAGAFVKPYGYSGDLEIPYKTDADTHRRSLRKGREPRE